MGWQVSEALYLSLRTDVETIMSTYYSVYADKTEDDNEIKPSKEVYDEDEHCIVIDVKDIPEGTEKLIFRIW